MQEKYIIHIPKLDHLTGFLHQKRNLFALLMEAKYLNRTAIIPNLYLNGKHNNGNNICTSWNAYIDLNHLLQFSSAVLSTEIPYLDDLESITVNEEVIPEELINNNSELIIRKHLTYPNYYRIIDILNNPIQLHQLEELFIYNKNIKKYALNAILKMKNYHCLHIRRGDKLLWKQYPGLDKATQPKQILNFLNKHIDLNENIYIMTNEPNDSFYDNLKSEYKIFSINEFYDYQKLKEKDNYFLFCVENEIMNNAKVKIKTFKEDGYISLLNYGSNGKRSFSKKVLKKLKRLFNF